MGLNAFEHNITGFGTSTPNTQISTQTHLLTLINVCDDISEEYYAASYRFFWHVQREISSDPSLNLTDNVNKANVR